MAQQSFSKYFTSLSVMLVLSCYWSGNVFADEDRIEALEARVIELENLVHQLLQKQRVPVDTATTVEAKAEEAAEARLTVLLDEHQQAVAEAAHKHSFKFGGFIKADAIYSDFGGGSVASGSSGRDFYNPSTIPVGESGESYLDLHAKETRLNFRSTHLLDNGTRIGTFIEMDFMLSGHGDDRISNSYNPRMRHAFATYDNWLFGQTWMTFFNVGALPENLDFIGPSDATIFGRQVMIRYSNGPWTVALENPETTITPYGGGGRIVADDSQLPDAVLRYNLEGDWGLFTVAGIFRQLVCEDAITGVDDSTSGYGISLSGKFEFENNDDFRWMLSSGKGLGRYIGLNTANGAVLDTDGHLNAIDSTGAFGSYRHLWSEKWRSNLTLAYLAVDNDTRLTGLDVTKSASSLHLNLIYSPQPKLDFGAEFIYADREVESGEDGDLKRLQLSAKYAF